MNALHENKEHRTNLERLRNLTRSNPGLMMEMISLYLEQTPTLVKAMKHGFNKKDLKVLHKAVHTMIPSFSIMGISVDFENMAKKIQEFAVGNQQESGTQDLVIALEKVCDQACEELKIEFDILKATTR